MTWQAVREVILTIASRVIVLPNGLLVVHERLVELPLLLEDGRQVGVRRRELGKHLQGLQVQPVKEEGNAY